MDRLGYTAMTAASRTMSSLTVRANNLANVNTPGFRADLEQAQAVAVEGYGYDSRHLAQVKNNGVSLTPGALMATGRDLDVAIQGPGLFVVEGENGAERYTRNGALQVDAELRLTLNGRAVLGEGGPIVLPEYDAVVAQMESMNAEDPQAIPLLTQAMDIWFREMPDVFVSQLIIRYPMSTQRWTGWPTDEDPYGFPHSWQQEFLKTIIRLEPATS